MPTYADEMAARFPRSNAHNGPVRLWISSGEFVRNADGQLVMTERWEEEEIMDTDVDLMESIAFFQSGEERGSLANALHSNSLLRSSSRGQTPRGGSILVLDTNTLLSSLPICMAIFTQCLARNVHTLSTAPFLASPIMLVVPYVVVRELDGLKSSVRKESAGLSSFTVGQKAQRANRWMLDAMKQQKKRSYIDDGGVSNLIPEYAWVLHVESSSFYRASRLDSAYREETPDDEIISHCRALQRDTEQTVWLCSDDVNMKLRAESDSIVTFSMAEWSREELGTDVPTDVPFQQDRDVSLTEAVSGLIDQWSGQMDVHLTHASTNSTVDGDFGSSDVSMIHDPGLLPTKRTGGGLEDSIYASRKPPVDGRAEATQRHPMRRRSQNSSHALAGILNEPTHIYSADRSSASSMWAKRP